MFLHVAACFLYMCMGVIDCSIQVFGRIISCIDDVMRLDAEIFVIKISNQV